MEKLTIIIISGLMITAGTFLLKSHEMIGILFGMGLILTGVVAIYFLIREL